MIFVLGPILGIVDDIIPDATRGVGATGGSPLHNCVARIFVQLASIFIYPWHPYRDRNAAVQSGNQRVPRHLCRVPDSKPKAA